MQSLKIAGLRADKGGMTKLIAAILFLTATVCAQRPTVERLDEVRAELRPFLDALIHVESNGDDNAVGDKGKALGCLQIWEIYWTDAVEYAPKLGGKYDDVRQRIYAERVVCAYLLRYARHAVAEKNYEVLARIHNGGPAGASKKATQGYWVKVSKALKG